MSIKKEKFDKLVELIAMNPLLYSSYKITNKDGLEVHCFGDKDNKSLEEAKALFRGKGYKGDDVYAEANALNNQGKLVADYTTFLYNAEKDKISIGLFRTGYAYANKKQRFYPIKKNEPVLAWTKHIYCFRRELTNKISPRIQLGGVSGSELSTLITKTLYNIDYIPDAWISYRHFIDTKDEYEALERYTGSKLPEALKHYRPSIILALYKSLKDFTKFDTIIGHIFSTHPKCTNINVLDWNMDEYRAVGDRLAYIHYDLFVLIICNKITDQEYNSILTISNSVDIENITIAEEIIKIKIEDGGN
jgi:hypothetical protein